MQHGLHYEPRLEELLNAVRGFSCTSRIPKRCAPGRPALKRHKIKTVATETIKSSFDSLPQRKTKPTVRFAASVQDGYKPRPRSANRSNEEAIPTKTGLYLAPRSKTDKDRLQTTLKKPSIIPKRVNNTNMPVGNKSVKTNAVPLTKNQSPLYKSTAVNKENVISQRQLNDMKRAISDSSQFDKGDPSSQTDVMQLKRQYEEKMELFERLRAELDDKQRKMLEVYAKLQQTHIMMSSVGQIVDLPSAEELRVLNVANLTPEQILNLTEQGTRENDDSATNTFMPIDMKKLNNLPNNLLSTCEQTLTKRKELINWLESLVKSKGIKYNNLIGKINEFTVENEMFGCSLQNVKTEFLQELNEIISHLRQGVSETMQLRVRNEELTCEIAELDAKNTQLRKQLHTSDHLKSNSNRARVEELEKALKDEKYKRAIIRDRLTRTEGQIKMGSERAAQLENSLDESRSKIWHLEKTVQELHEQKNQLQFEFDQELYKLTESIKENTENLEKIAEDREKLQLQKEDLEKRLQELSDYYNESLNNAKAELHIKVAMVIEAEKKYNAEIEERKKAEAKEEIMKSQLRESQQRYMELCKNLEEKENEINEAKALKSELDIMEKCLKDAKAELDDYKSKLIDQTSLICNIEHNNQQLLNEKAILKSQLSHKIEHINNLEQKQHVIEEQLQDNQNKMQTYEEQLNSLRNQISELQEDFGNFENFNELRQMVNQQRAKLLEATRQNGELAEALQNKDLELEQQNNIFIKHEEIVNKLSHKEQEYAAIIKGLHQNLEIKKQTEVDLTRKLNKKEEEFQSLSSKLEKKQQQVVHLEKIVLTFEEQTRKQRKCDRERIEALEQKIADYESHVVATQQALDSPPENEAIDKLMKILEDELGSPFEPQIGDQTNDIIVSRKNSIGDCTKKVRLENFTCNETTTNIPIRETNVPTKIVMGNFVKKTYNISRNERFEKPDRKKAITNMGNFRKWTPAVATAPEYQNYETPLKNKPMKLFQNMPNLTSDLREDRKYNKMLKLAGHRM